MKKLVLIMALFLTTNVVANAYVDSQFLKTEKFLVNTGYSAEMPRVLSMTGDNPYRDVYVEPTKPKDVFRRIYHYIVPGQNQDLDFYNHSIDNNGWSWKDY